MTTTTTIGSLEIERTHAPTREEFGRDHVDRNKPVLMTGVAESWPAIANWTPDYLKRVAGDSIVETAFDEDGDHGNGPRIACRIAREKSWVSMFRAAFPHAGIRKNISFGELLDLLLSDPPDTRHFLTTKRLSRVSAKLVEDLNYSGPPFQSGSIRPVIFLGRDCFTVNHYHGAEEAVCCPILGGKRVTLFAPDQTRNLYPYPWHTPILNLSQVDDRNPDLEKFPRFKRAKRIVVDVKVGESLYIPLQWWHSVWSPGFSIGITLFWPAKRSNFRYPAPSLQLLANQYISPVALKMRWNRLIGRKPGGTKGSSAMS